MKLILKGKPKHSLTPELERYAQEKFLRLKVHLADAAVVEVVLASDKAPQEGVNKAVRVTMTLPHEKNPIHLEEVSQDFRASIDVAQERAERLVQKSKERNVSLHRRVIGKSQEVFTATARQTAAIPGSIWRTIRRQLSKRGW